MDSPFRVYRTRIYNPQRRPQGFLLDDFQNGGYAILKIVEEKALGTRLEFLLSFGLHSKEGSCFSCRVEIVHLWRILWFRFRRQG